MRSLREHGHAIRNGKLCRKFEDQSEDISPRGNKIQIGENRGKKIRKLMGISGPVWEFLELHNKRL